MSRTGEAVDIRAAAAADHDAVAALNRAAFGGEDEVGIVQRLRRDDLVAVELVAVRAEAIIGYILFSWLPTVVDGRAVKTLALAPMAVRPGAQKRGIGGRLMAALDGARGAGAEAVIVLGHPGYYPRFGFSAALASKLASPFSGEAFMALELVPGALAGQAGAVTYPPAFGL
ncbi:MAG: N-acetyltransferase [Bosea sp.]|uniref:GNAT family N-acetyltransferase n=1 Tax=Bosea sp. (in: a-proteobacteria) TaxID=1871050 RepID=UPI001ACE62BD|nr:N-acetyltransferase [Bosea sp. (in: a-proteobacteria)]MBN9467539.1 N-acetyltransferase [Bosea sp. (in: a-proteobacteria)]